ncbi:hypothetical protein EDD39_3962 [Kitasatospora cineracea]|uniref:Leucine rich repeat (LRR) protein n=1 Tax=Kitasatospora cineracea TaxID=88074 RepID=A0A8G1UKU5_9ACTN|nr:hypothetical protein EDD39_3962 [Kitasatospora cineracea]
MPWRARTHAKAPEHSAPGLARSGQRAGTLSGVVVSIAARFIPATVAARPATGTRIPGLRPAAPCHHDAVTDQTAPKAPTAPTALGEPTAPGEPYTTLLRGIAANPNAGTAVLTRLLVPAGGPAWRMFGRRPLPADFVDTALAHPERRVRSAVAANPWLSDTHCLRLARDPVDLVALQAVNGSGARRRPAPLPDAAVELLLLGTWPRETEFLTRDEILGELHSLGALRNAFRRKTAHHPEPELRRQACQFIGALPPDRQAALLADPDPGVRAEARRVTAPKRLTPEELADTTTPRVLHSLYQTRVLPPDLLADALAARDYLSALARNRHLPPDAVRTLAADPDPEVRRLIARHPALVPDLMADLAADADPDVRHRLAGHPALTPALIDALAADPDPEVAARALADPAPRDPARGRVLDEADPRETPERFRQIDFGVVDEPVDPPDPDWYRACARSPLPLLRRAAATCPHLDELTVSQLSQDEEREVRHLLALHHPAAPAGPLLEASLCHPRHRDRLRARPAFPRTGLPSGLARHPDPEVRELAAADPEFDGDPETLLADPHHLVRLAAATNPRLRPERVAALLADPELREGAAANPQLGEERLHALLDGVLGAREEAAGQGVPA